MAEGIVMLYSAPLEQGWPKLPGVHPPPVLCPLSPLSPPLPLCLYFSTGLFWHARVKSAGFLIHLNPLSNCVMSLSSVPHLTWRLPRPNKGINNELCSHQETRSALKQNTENWWKSVVSMYVFFFFPFNFTLVTYFTVSRESYLIEYADLYICTKAWPGFERK